MREAMDPSTVASEPIAIIGSGCRFPGGVSSPSRLWELLLQPHDLSQRVPANRFNVDGFYHPDGEYHGTTNAPKAYWLEQDHRHFDASFFNITPKEAEAIDPQGKIILETVYEAMESAGLTLQKCSGEQISVFVGTMTADFDILSGKDEMAFSQYCATGTSRAILSNRVSYFFNWNGPSMTIDTACSSSLVAMHQAVLALRRGESSMACVAGANVMLSPEYFICEANLHMLSPHGKSRMWDTGANGYARGEGVGVVFLKPLSKALADGDSIECIVRETGVNSDGRTKGITMPSPDAQAALIRDTYRRAGLDSQNPSHRPQYFEAHGTGTQAGDPREAEAIYRAFFGDPPDDTDPTAENDGNLLVGSIKTVIGHTEGAAGVAGVIKVALALKHLTIPPNQHLQTINPTVAPFTTRLRVPTSPTPWPLVQPGQPIRASVNSFGFGGTNGHVILERYDPQLHGGLAQESLSSNNCLTIPFALSANSDKALTSLAERYAKYLNSTPNVNIHDLAATLMFHRSELPHKATFAATGITDLVTSIEARLANSEKAELGIRSKTLDQPPRILGVFTGQGAQWPEMGKHLIISSPIFAKSIHQLDQFLRGCPNPPPWSLQDELLADGSRSRLGEAALSQPLCTAVQIALVDLLAEAGVKLTAVVGHSSGEIAAAYAAGVLTSRDAMLIAYYRGYHAKLSRGRNGEKGGMLAVGMRVEDALDLCEQENFHDQIYIAASNAPASVTLSGDLDKIKHAKEALDEQGKFARLLKVDTAYHSHHMDSCAGAYLESLSSCGITAREPDPSCSWISSVYGPAGNPTVEELSGRYWRDNMVQPVLFSEALQRVLIEQDSFQIALEVGPHPALKGPATQTMQEAIGHVLPYSGVLSRGSNDIVAFAAALGLVWNHLGSSAVDFARYSKAAGIDLSSRQVIKDLPTYPWDHHQPHYRLPRLPRQYLRRSAAPHELLGVRTSDDSDSEYRWRNILQPRMLPWLNDHRFQGQIIVPAAAYCVMALDAARSLARSLSISTEMVEIQDLFIQAGITMADDSQGVETLFSLKRERHAFKNEGAIVASFFLDWAPVEGEMPMKNAVTGTVRIHTPDPLDNGLPTRMVEEGDLNTVDLDDFYSSVRDIGLGYTGPFRALQSLQRRLNFATGKLQKPHPEDPCQLPVRPSLLDACFQVAFAAFAAPGDGDLWTSFLPKKIEKLRFNLGICEVRPDANDIVDVDAAITRFEATTLTTPANFSGDISVYSPNGEMEIQIEGLNVASFTAATKADDRELFLQTIWELDPWHGFREANNTTTDASDVQLIHECDAIKTFYQARSHRRRSSSSFGEHTHSREKIEEMMASSPHRSSLELLHGCGEYIPSCMSGVIHEITNDNREVSSCHQQLKQIVSQISHRHPRIRVLEINIGEGGPLADIVASQLAPNFVSYRYLYEGHGPSPQFSSDRLQSKVTIDMLPEDRSFLVDDGLTSLCDLVIVSLATETKDDVVKLLNSVREHTKPGGYLLVVQSTGPFLRERLLRCVSLTTTSVTPQAHQLRWGEVFQRAGFASDVSSQFHTPSRRLTLSISYATNPLIEILRKPVSLGRSQVPMPGKVLVLGGSRPETQAIKNRLTEVLVNSNVELHMASLEDELDIAKTEDIRGVLILSDLDEPIMASMTNAKLSALQAILAPNRFVLWLTNGSREDNPYHFATAGLCRSIKAETPGLQLQILDLDTLDGVADQVVESFLRLAMANDEELKNSLWTTEHEIAIQNGHAMLPRVLPIDDLNDRYNATRRVVTREANSAQSVIDLVASRDGSDCVYSAQNTGKTALQLAAINQPDLVVVRMLYTSAWAAGIGDGSYAFVGVGMLLDGRRVIAVSPTNTSYAVVPSSWTKNVPASWGDDATIVGLLVRALVVQCIVAQASSGPIAIHEADSALADVLESFVQSQDSIRPLRHSTHDPHKPAVDSRFAFIHRRATADAIRSLIPAFFGTFVDFSNGTSSISKGILPDSTFCLNPTTSSVRICGNIQVSSDAISRCLSNAIRTIQPLIHSSCQICSIPVNTVLESRNQRFFGVVDWQSESLVQERVRAIDPASALSPSKTYVMIGLTGELGQSICRMMVTNGARYIIAASRNPDKSPRWKREFEQMGVTVEIMSLDVTNLQSVKRLKAEISRSFPPVAGVANGAMLLSDGLFADMTLETFDKVMKPKVVGSRNLDLVFNSKDMDFFMMFSSLTGVAGNKGQSNYTAANMFMAGLAAQRRKGGLAASVLDIGMLYGIGYINRIDGAEIYNNLKNQGYTPISERDIHCMFIEAIAAGKRGSIANSQLTTGLQRFSLTDDHPLAWHFDPRFSHHTISSQDSADVDKSGSAQTVQDLIRESQSLESVAQTIRESFATQLESMLRLEAGTVNTEKSIIDLGVDSLVAVEVRSWFLKEVGKDMPVLKVLGGASIAALSDEIAADVFADRATAKTPVDERAEVPSSDASTIDSDDSDRRLFSSDASETSDTDVGEWELPEYEQIVPMSFGHTRMWIPNLLLTDKTAYNCTTCYRLNGSLDVLKLETALECVIQRHQTFRSSFFIDEISREPVQAVSRSSPFSLKKVQQGNDGIDVERETDEIKKHVYDLANGDVFMATLVTHEPQYHTIIFGYNHIIVDGVGWQLFLQDLERFYVHPTPQRQHPVVNDVTDFSVQQRGGLDSKALQSKRTFWKSAFDKLPSPMPLFPFSKVTRRETLDRYAVSEYFVELDRSLVTRVKAASTENKVTPFHFYLSVLQVLLQRALGKNDFCLGITDANRADERFMETIGLLLDTLPLWFKVPRDESFQERLLSTRSAVYDALGNSGVPLDVILDDANVESSVTDLPLFQAMVNYRMGAIKQKTMGDVQLDYLSYEDAKHPFDFILTIDEDEGRGGLTLSMQDYLYDEAGADIFLETYIHLLEQFSSDPSMSTEEPTLLPVHLGNKAISLGSGPLLPGSSVIKKTLVHEVDEMTTKYPHEIALKDDHVAYTYDQMATKVYTIGTILTEKGALTGRSRVAVFCEQSVDMVCSLLAILRIGATYVPCDVRNSDQRLSVIISESQAEVVICDQSTFHRLEDILREPSLASASTEAINVTALEDNNSSPFVPNRSVPSAKAFLMFTSGSTGKPKGILLTHANFSTQVAAATASMGIKRETVLQQSALGYDASLAQIFYALANGGTLVISSNRREIQDLASLMVREKVTFTLMAPSEYTVLLEYGRDILRQSRTWRVAMCGGEAFAPHLIEALQGLQLDQLEVFNAYGEYCLYRNF
ncbi:uncharacterized protein TRUGW13939_10315 [Talaromyces rugulosus]|uniref:Uncharacterized protein n=1 Tax=Talaromyces rugulosus TaxID=121627 RepID=A0A7H8RA16_TALRU|nr:uncharacterized protein TRUGW13939_10315 [Talaromyces rugulosus]QKX63146.1 hypothetical protein TRUGW13939_10315 [Talaromyces rugulosus]